MLLGGNFIILYINKFSLFTDFECLLFLQNDMLGPAGYGDARFIPASTTIAYTIRFENHENASAPAQRVYIVHTLDDDLDIRTFKIGSFGFGDFNRTIQKGKTYLQVSMLIESLDSELVCACLFLKIWILVHV